MKVRSATAVLLSEPMPGYANLTSLALTVGELGWQRVLQHAAHSW
jgi:hypothetical protein